MIEIKNKKNINISVLKIIACFLVVINHTSNSLLKFPGNLNVLFYSLELVLCRIAVPIFIICTGFLMYDKNITPKYILKKIKRILIPLVLFSFIIYFLQNKNFNILLFFKTFISNPIIEIYWYLYMLIGLYLMMPILKFFKKFRKKDYIYTILLCSIVPAIFDFLTKLFKINISLNLTENFFSQVIVYYIIGMFFHTLKENKNKNMFKSSIIIYLVLNLLAIIYIFLNIHKDINFIYSLLNINSLIIVLSSILFVNIILNINFCFTEKTTKFINNFSNLTFGIYLLHPLLINKLYNFKIMSSIFDFNAILGVIIYEIILFVICALIIYMFKAIYKRVSFKKI